MVRGGAGIAGQDDSELVQIRLGRGGEALADGLDVADGGDESVGLIEKRVLPGVRALVLGRSGVEVVGNVIDRDTRLVMRGIEEVLEEFRHARRQGQRHAHESGLGADPVDGADHPIVNLAILRRRHLMLKFHLVEDLPDGDLVVMARVVAPADLVGEPTLGVPADQAGIVIGQFPAARISQLGSLAIVPDGLDWDRLGRGPGGGW